MDNDVFIEMRTMQRTEYPASSVKIWTACSTLTASPLLMAYKLNSKTVPVLRSLEPLEGKR